LVPVSSGVVLDNLVAPILRSEVDNIIKRMPADKALGPDGFNGVFYQKMLAHNQRRYLQTFL
jgi:hypothetical protein